MSKNNKDEMPEEYDFRGKQGVRGKYYEALRKGHQTIIHKTDGTTIIKEKRPIYLDEDLQTIFPDSLSVNRALRKLISAK